MAPVVYVTRRRDICLGPIESTDCVPIRRAEWLAIIALDPTLVLRPEIECGCAEWVASGAGESEAMPRAGGKRSAVPAPSRLVLHRRGRLEVSASDEGLVAKLIEIAGQLRPAGDAGAESLYLGLSVPRTDDFGPMPHTRLGLILDLALGRAPARQSGRRRRGAR